MSSMFQRWRSRSPSMAVQRSGSTSAMVAHAAGGVATVTPDILLLRGGTNVRFGDCARPQNLDLTVLRAGDNRRWHSSPDRAVVEDQRDFITDRRHDLVCSSRVGLARNVRRAH